MTDIADLIKQLAGPGRDRNLIIGKVTSVDKLNCTCDVIPENSEAELQDVQLRSVVDGEKLGLVIYPKVGSYVLVHLIENSKYRGYVGQYSEADSIIMNGGENGGMINIVPLVMKLQQTEDRLNQVILNLKQPAALGVPIDPITLPIVPLTTRQDLEDINVKH